MDVTPPEITKKMKWQGKKPRQRAATAKKTKEGNGRKGGSVMGSKNHLPMMAPSS